MTLITREMQVNACVAPFIKNLISFCLFGECYYATHASTDPKSITYKYAKVLCCVAVVFLVSARVNFFFMKTPEYYIVDLILCH